MTGRHAGMLAILAAMAAVSAGCDAPAPAAAQSPRGTSWRPGSRPSSRSSPTRPTSWPTSAITSRTSGSPAPPTTGRWPTSTSARPKSHLRWAVRRIPIRKDNKGHDINLTAILEAFENSQLTQLKRTIDGKDRAAFEKIYKDSLTVCYSCHTAADKPYLRPRVPAEPESRIIQFDPRADWPL